MPDGSTSIPLILNDRESRGPLLAALEALDAFDLRVERLKLGDVLVNGALTFERKTVVDLAASIVDGRLFDQSLRLAACKRPAALIIEGRAADLARTGMRIEAFQGALVNIALLIGLPLWRSRSPEESARLIQFAARQWRRAANGALPRLGRRPTGKRTLQDHVLQGLRGLGPEHARLAVEPSHCAAAAELPMHHRAPFDRMLIAQAQHEGLGIVSADPALDAYKVERIW